MNISHWFSSIHQVLNIWAVFTFLAIMNNTIVNICVQDGVYVYVTIQFHFFHVYKYSKEQNCQFIWQLCLIFLGTARLFPKQQHHLTLLLAVQSVPILVTCPQNLYMMRVKHQLILVFTCIFLLANIIKHLFTYLLSICISSLDYSLLLKFMCNNTQKGLRATSV